MQLDYLEADLLKVIIKKGLFSSHISESKRNEKHGFQANTYKPFVLISILFSDIGLLQEKHENNLLMSL